MEAMSLSRGERRRDWRILGVSYSEWTKLTGKKGQRETGEGGFNEWLGDCAEKGVGIAFQLCEGLKQLFGKKGRWKVVEFRCILYFFPLWLLIFSKD